MWRATTDDEANFIHDLLADRENDKVVEDYAVWLDQRDPLRAEFLRLQSSANPDEARLAVLAKSLDSRWLTTVTGRTLRAGDAILITAGYYKGIKARIQEVDAVNRRADVILDMLYRPIPIWISFSDFRIVSRK